jgi:hypothetical protein
VRIALDVGERVVLAVVGHPGDHRALDRHRAEDRDHRAERPRGLKRPVREHPVVAERHAHAGDHVQTDEQPELQRPDRAVPQHHYRRDQSGQGCHDADQVGDLVAQRHGAEILDRCGTS